MKNVFYFILKPIFFLEMFKFLSSLFDYVRTLETLQHFSKSDLPQVKQNLITNMKNFVYKLHRKLPNYFKTQDLSKLGSIRKISIWVKTQSLIHSFVSSNKILTVVVKMQVNPHIRFLLDFVIYFQIFCPTLFQQTNFCS